MWDLIGPAWTFIDQIYIVSSSRWKINPIPLHTRGVDSPFLRALSRYDLTNFPFSVLGFRNLQLLLDEQDERRHTFGGFFALILRAAILFSNGTSEIYLGCNGYHSR
jgi:hypothetical protein